MHSSVGIGITEMTNIRGGAVAPPQPPSLGITVENRWGQWVRISNKENGTQESLKRQALIKCTHCMPSRIQGWWNGIGIQVQTGLLDHLVQVRSNANRIKSHYNLEVLEVIALPYVHQTTWSASVLLPTGSKVFINTCTFYINIPPLSPSPPPSSFWTFHWSCR